MRCPVDLKAEERAAREDFRGAASGAVLRPGRGSCVYGGASQTLHQVAQMFACVHGSGF